MSRIDLPANEHEQIVISRSDFMVDWNRGYCALEIFPERENTLVDTRTGRELKTTTPAVVSFRCMKCAFDVCNSSLAGAVGKRKSATEVMEAHLQNGNHNWPYPAFSNPYGRDADIMIEGIDHYAVDIGAL